MASESYQPSWLADFLHSFPRLDLTFQPANSTFNPFSAVYRESLVFWAAVPLLWLVLTLIVFLVYFCYRCCQRDVEKKQKVPCLKWSMAVLAMITIGGVGMGFYGNEVGHYGVKIFSEACKEGESLLQTMQEQSSLLESTVADKVKPEIDELQRSYNSNNNIERNIRLIFDSKTQRAFQAANDVYNTALQISRRAEHIHLGDAPDLISEYEFYRWLGVCLLLVWMVILCLLLLLGIGLTSKCTLLMFCAFGIFTLVLSWLTAGLHLGLNVGLADFCVSPGDYFERIGQPRIERDVLRYYFECSDSIDDPFEQALLDAEDKVYFANETLNNAIDEASSFTTNNLEEEAAGIYEGFEEMRVILLSLTSSVQCPRLHGHYKDGIEGLCNTSLPGLCLLLLSAMVSGLLFTVLVVLASRAWRHFGSKKAYMEVEDDDPFLPRPDNSSPSYYRYGSLPAGNSRPTSLHEDNLPSGVVHTDLHMPFSRSGGRVGRGADGSKSLGRRSTPPPAYNSNEFYRQYGDVNHSDDMNPDYMQVRESHA